MPHKMTISNETEKCVKKTDKTCYIRSPKYSFCFSMNTEIIIIKKEKTPQEKENFVCVIRVDIFWNSLLN